MTKKKSIENFYKLLADALNEKIDLKSSRKFTVGLARQTLSILFRTIVTYTRDNSSLRIPYGFTFKVVTLKERNGVNPRTRERISIPSRRAIKVYTSKFVKRLMLGSAGEAPGENNGENSLSDM